MEKLNLETIKNIVTESLEELGVKLKEGQASDISVMVMSVVEKHIGENPVTLKEVSTCHDKSARMMTTSFELHKKAEPEHVSVNLDLDN